MDWVRLLLAVTKHECGGQFERFMLEKDGSRYQECAKQAETEDSAEKVQCSML